MQKNMGKIDQIIRIIIAIVCIVLNFRGGYSERMSMFLLIVATVLAVTSLIGYCPLYAPFGIRTKKEE